MTSDTPTFSELRVVPDLNVAPLEILRRDKRPRVAIVWGGSHDQNACLVRRIPGSLAPIDYVKHAPDAFPPRYAAVGDHAADPGAVSIDFETRHRAMFL